MKFNIKNWQDKHLIKESKGLKREIDFKSDDAFKKYNAKHKMRKTTKVNIAGKDTTAGEETGKEKKAAGPADTKYRPVDSQQLGDILTSLDQEASGYYDDGGQTGLIDHMENAFDAAGLFDSDEPITYQNISDAVDAYDGLDNENNPETGEKWTPEDIEADKESMKTQLQGEMEAEEDEADKADKAEKGAARDARESAGKKKTPLMGDDGNPVLGKNSEDFKGQIYDNTPEGKAGNITKKTNFQSKDSNGNRVYTVVDPHQDPEEARWGEHGWPTGATYRMDDETKEIYKSEDPNVTQFVPSDKPEVQAIVTAVKDSMLQYSGAGQYSVKSSDEPIKNAKKAGVSRQDVQKELYNLMDRANSIYPIEPEPGYDYIPAGVKNRNKIDAQLDDIYGQDKNESVTPKSTRIQEARIYRTIQQLKGLEKN